MLIKNDGSKISGGYILQPRKLDKSAVMKESPIVRELWMYLLRKVNWKNSNFPRGTGFFRFANIQNDLCWYVGFRKMKYSKPRLTKALRRLCEGNMTATMKATRGIIITVLNYDYYQDPKNYEGNDEDPMKILRRSKGRFTIIKEREEVKEEKNKERTFAQFWGAYPKKRNKGQAEKAFKKIKPTQEILKIMLSKIKQFKKSPDWQKDSGQYIPYPATWLNAKGWEDEIDERQDELFPY